MAKYRYIPGKETFVNPYNFVPVRFDQRAESDETDEMMTGYFDCKIVAKTPLAIIDSESVWNTKETIRDNGKTKVVDHPHYKFFRVDDNPAIPASSIRGMVRSVYETITDSCFSTMPTTALNQEITNRSKKALRPGILEKTTNGTWELFAANRYLLKVKDGESVRGKNKEVWDTGLCPVYGKRGGGNEEFYIHDDDGEKRSSGDIVLFDALTDHSGKEIKYECKRGGKYNPVATRIHSKGKKQGILVLGEIVDNSNKHHESIFAKGSKLGVTSDEIARALKKLDATYEAYNNKSINGNLNIDHFGYQSYKEMRKNGLIPVWYMDAPVLRFSLAAMGRVTNQKTMKDLVGKKYPCRTRDSRCPACQIFGMISENEGKSAGSQIRFSDAKAINCKIRSEEVTLAELSSPKVTYMPFYSTANYERKGRNAPSYDDGIGIKGRKYYWHSENFGSLNKGIEKNDRTASVEICEDKSTFSFRVYFDGIGRGQLEKLIYTINLGENKEDGVFCHKIGHGKPIGLGSVKITVGTIFQRQFSANGYYITLCEVSKEGTPNGINEDIDPVKSLKTIMDFSRAQKVHYPYIKPKDPSGERYGSNDLASHQWFKENESAGLQGHDHEVQVLPAIVDPQELKIYLAEKIEGEDRSRSERHGQKKKQVILQIGRQYEGIINGYNNSKTVAYIALKGGRRASLYFKDVGAQYGEIDKELILGETVTLKYNGKDSRDFDLWTVMRTYLQNNNESDQETT